MRSAELAVAQAQARLEGTRRHLEDSQRIMVEARALGRLAALPAVPPGEERSTPEVVQYRGASAWTLAQVEQLERFFAARFGRPLPVSALGQTPLHDRLGFDHRNAVDVAVHPDTVEGRTLLDHLRAQRIPFLAFRGRWRARRQGRTCTSAPPPRGRARGASRNTVAARTLLARYQTKRITEAASSAPIATLKIRKARSVLSTR